MGVTGFFDGLIRELRQEGRLSTARSFVSTKHSLAEFAGGDEVRLEDIDAQFVADYASFLRKKGVVSSTLAFYMRVLRRALAKARSAGLRVAEAAIFEGTDTRSTHESSRPESFLSREELRQLRDLPLECGSGEALARDLFLFSFYCGGMELVDIASLTYGNITGEKLQWQKRRKGRKQSVKLNESCKEILKRWKRQDSNFLFPLTEGEEGSRFHNVRNAVSGDLREVGRKAGLTKGLSFSMARYSREELEKQIEL